MPDCNTHSSHVTQKPFLGSEQSSRSVGQSPLCLPRRFLQCWLCNSYLPSALALDSAPLHQLEFTLYQVNLIHEIQSPAEVLELILGGGAY